MGIQKEKQVGRAIIFARVSNAGQKADLANQIEFLIQYANVKGFTVNEVLTDISSGLNYQRKNLNKILDESIEGNIEHVIISHKDSCVRF